MKKITRFHNAIDQSIIQILSGGLEIRIIWTYLYKLCSQSPQETLDIVYFTVHLRPSLNFGRWLQKTMSWFTSIMKRSERNGHTSINRIGSRIFPMFSGIIRAFAYLRPEVENQFVGRRPTVQVFFNFKLKPLKKKNNKNNKNNKKTTKTKTNLMNLINEH